MIDPDAYLYYITFAFVSCALLVFYVRAKSSEGTVITTKDYQMFQTAFVTGYGLVIFAELVASASFYHVLMQMHLSLEQVTRLYLASTISSTLGAILLEIADIGARKDKCVLCALLFSGAMFSVFFGGHYEMLLLGRIAYGLASALQHSCFEAYALHTHASSGFPDDWLSHTFGFLTHIMALLAALTGIVGQFAADSGTHGCIAVCTGCFALASVYLLVVWEKDVNAPRFMLSGFLFNVNQSLNTIRSNRQMGVFVAISALCETAIVVFTFYWAPWLTSILGEEDDRIPYELIFATFVSCSMLGNYLFQMLLASSLSHPVETIFQGVLVVTSVSYFLGALFQTSFFAYMVSLVVQGCVGLYWPCIGYFRGKIVVPELRNVSLLFPK